MTTKPQNSKTKRPFLPRKRANDFIDKADKLKFDFMVQVKILLAELNSHDFEPSDDYRVKYKNAAKFAQELERFIASHIEQHSTKVEKVLVATHGVGGQALSRVLLSAIESGCAQAATRMCAMACGEDPFCRAGRPVSRLELLLEWPCLCVCLYVLYALPTLRCSLSGIA